MILMWMRLSRFALFGLVIATVLFLIQYRLYVRARRHLQAMGVSPLGQRRVLLILRVLLLIMNLPWVIGIGGSLLLDWSLFSSWERLGSWASYVVYPFAVWQYGSVIAFVVLVVLDVVRMIWRWSRAALRFLGRWPRSMAAVPPQPEGGAGTSPEQLTVTASYSAPHGHGQGPEERPSGQESRLLLSRRRFIQTAGVSIATLPYIASAYGAIQAADQFVIERVDIPLPNLPDALVGLTIVHLTDIHVGPFMSEERWREYVRVVNRLEPDLIVLTGDYVASSARSAIPFVRGAAELRARYGVFGSLGNHDRFTEAVPLLVEGFARHGMKILYNEQVWVRTPGGRINLIGIDYIGQSGRGFARALRGLRLEGPSILLSHQPNVFPQAAGRAIDLTLAGHTHGGQMVADLAGIRLSPARLITPYVAGLYEHGGAKLYVSRGLGTTGPPVRLNAPPEITLIRLVR
ncbi:MAG TPA: metallophosphoesterase [Blastocatellia bacterium]|nr:metallophosphoesterase [Blastocatellia bacterium]